MSANIATNPKRDSVLSGITQYDLMDGLGSNNSGCLVDFGVDAENFTILKLVTWNMVFKGGIVGLQVWSQRKDIRNLGTAFNNRKKPNIGLVSLLNAMYFEMYGDRLQCTYLIACFYRTQLKQKQLDMKQMISLKESEDDKEQVLFEGENYHDLISAIDVIFKEAIIQTYTSFSVLGQALV